MGKGYRQGRLGEEIKKLISELLLRGDIKDPRLSGFVSVSAVEVTSDGSYATVYVTVLGGTIQDKEKLEKEKEDVIAAFRSAKGMIKREIGKSIKIRHIPDLIFKMDTSLEYGRHISKIINDLGIENYSNVEESEEENE
ncbi:MAG: 30S ribosome-binding factor RbfA [Aminipila sp.]